MRSTDIHILGDTKISLEATVTDLLKSFQHTVELSHAIHADGQHHAGNGKAGAPMEYRHVRFEFIRSTLPGIAIYAPS